MDLGMVGLDGLVVGSSDSCFPSSDPDHETKLKWYGSGFLKQERIACAAAAAATINTTTEDDWSRRSLIKVAKTDSDFSANNSKAMLLQQRGPSLMRSNSSSLLSNGQQMLSFSSPNSQTLTSPYSHPTSTTTYSRNAGYGSEGLNALTMHGVLTGVRGPFTPSQWMELEHQALIYKYITANVPIPSNLLFPIKKALDSVGFSSFSGGPLRPSTLGWGGFHLGFSNNADPEPGRCRRTDGKKWRCSRDAVADQKYCERHMNRGRHRSRKPVEGQSGHSVSGATAGKVNPVASSTAGLVVAGGRASNSHGLKNLQSGGALNPCASSPHVNRIFLDKESLGGRIQDATDLSMLSPTIHLKENQFSIPKQHNTCEETSRAEFGRVCSDSLLNPLHKSPSLITSRNYGSCQDLNNDRENESQRPVRQFIDDWPKTQTNRSAISWPNLDLQTDRTQLSISIPVAASDFMSSASSPANEKLALSPLRLSRELNEPNQRQANWIPISWETSMGGPLGEVLNSTNSSAGDCKNSSALNLMTEGWDGSPRLESSPTGVLQKVTFGSLSNSSAGSSPRAENLGSTLVNSSLSLPAL